jgi:hypothetical protein
MRREGGAEQGHEAARRGVLHGASPTGMTRTPTSSNR